MSANLNSQKSSICIDERSENKRLNFMQIKEVETRVKILRIKKSKLETRG